MNRVNGSAKTKVRSTFILCSALFILLSCSKTRQQENENATKLRQYFVRGEKLYLSYCSNCHQTTGTGLGLLYPPLNKSDFIDQQFEKVVCLIRQGVSGELVVNGKTYNQPMPAMPQLSDLEVAEIVTYLYNNWDRSRGLISVQDVSAMQSKCKSD
jgi:cytochrome c551